MLSGSARPFHGGTFFTPHTLCLAIGLALPTIGLAQVKNDASVAEQAVQPVQQPPAPAAKAAPSKRYPIEAQGWGNKQGGPMWNVRWQEDWSYLKDPSKRKDVFDPLKFIPLNDAGDIYLTLGSELRVRSNTITEPGMVPNSHSVQNWLLRAFASADLHVGEHFRLYTELAHGSMDGRNEGAHAASQENNATLQQVFFDVTGKTEAADLGMRVGRQVFTDGPVQLMALRDNTDIYVAFNGVRGWAVGDNYRATVFSFNYTTDGTEGLGDDRIDRSRRLRGITTGIRLPTDKPVYLEPFFWQFRNDAQTWGSNTAKEHRNYYGLRLNGTFGSLKSDTWATFQNGTFGTRDIRAYMFSTSNAWTLDDKGWKPRVGFHAEISSGGNGGDTVRNANFLYGNTIYFSWATFFGPTNLATFSPTFVFSPTSKMTVNLEWESLWRQSMNDAIYNNAARPYARTATTGERHIGTMPRVNITYNFNQHWSAMFRAEHLLAGPALEKAGYGDSTFIAGWLNFRF